ncbi:4Fe-4S dicluster domain-containing protein [Desulfonema magnum]|uniref:4Fe-4S ferredoxin iron-sulfur binding domain protein n=1 Tax=Desulfonema magnum TaxID=45655 RepID=A0A975BRE2_9BACT|nr:4Fe-4S dicluster domain-containing protein [Desulfonema magnum]QTA89829.1 4Fe-4S ferredoxin iron-sulfur binding domain protein [Desulfonema magnum]
MKKVVVHPERCVGCMQCMIACATAHSQTKNLFSATLEDPLPRPRVHVGAGLYGEGFPNRCRHCDPAPCMFACLPGAIYRDWETDTVLIDPDKCINCASCAMACPFGVIRYHEDASAPLKKTVAVKCDNCLERQNQGLIPACVEVCKSRALTFEDPSDAMKRKTNEVAQSLSSDTSRIEIAPGFTLLNTIKRTQVELKIEN